MTPQQIQSSQPNWRDRIDCNPEVLVGKPRIKGTRISVAFVLECLRGGSSFDDLLRNYPHLTRDDIEAAIACAAETLNQARSLPPVISRNDW
jgi:uncharacterized protein (DUF433 family)